MISESTSLLAQLALLRGDQETLDETIAIWFDPARHYSETFQLAHWLLHPDGTKISNGSLRNASGEEARMLEVLTAAYERFGEERYRDLAVQVADGLFCGNRCLIESAGVAGDRVLDDEREAAPPHFVENGEERRHVACPEDEPVDALARQRHTLRLSAVGVDRAGKAGIDALQEPLRVERGNVGFIAGGNNHGIRLC